MNTFTSRWGALPLLVLLAGLVLSACQTTPGGGQLATPTFSTLEIPNGNSWATYSPTSPAAAVLPVKSRAVKIWFYAPLGSFTASLRALDGTITPLRDSHGAPQPPEAGYFEMVNVNANTTPPLHTMYVRAPDSLADPVNYDVLIVNDSMRTDVASSQPMVVSLRQRPVFTVTVQVQGDGRVTSNPAGIQCGTSASGRPLTDCTYTFGRGTITLAPGSGSGSKFIGWSGNCDPTTQVCSLTLDGTAAQSATAIFAPSSSSQTPLACQPAPLLPGLRWIDVPSCATGQIDRHPGIGLSCDTQGYFCCEPGPNNTNAPRCGGFGKIESSPDCLRNSPRGMLRQPGGCYELNTNP